MKLHLIIISLLLCLVLLPNMIIAQPFLNNAEGGPMNSERREAMREKIETLRMFKMIEALDITQEQSMQFFPLLNEFNDKKQEIHQENVELTKQLRDLLHNSSTKDSDIKSILDEMKSNRDKIHQLENDFFSDTEKILSIKQQAKYIIFQIEFQKELRGIINNIRAQKQGENRPNPDKKPHRKPFGR